MLLTKRLRKGANYLRLFATTDVEMLFNEEEEIPEIKAIVKSNKSTDDINSKIEGYFEYFQKTGRLIYIKRLFNKFKFLRKRLSLNMYNSMIFACNYLNDPETGVKTFEEMIKSGVSPNYITLYSMLTLYARHNYSDDFEYLYIHCKGEYDNKPDFHLPAFLNYYKTNHYPKTKYLVNYLSERRIPISISSLEIIMNTYIKNRLYINIIEIFYNFGKISPNFKSIIPIYLKAQEKQNNFEILDQIYNIICRKNFYDFSFIRHFIIISLYCDEWNRLLNYISSNIFDNSKIIDIFGYHSFIYNQSNSNHKLEKLLKERSKIKTPLSSFDVFSLFLIDFHKFPSAKEILIKNCVKNNYVLNGNVKLSINRFYRLGKYEELLNLYLELKDYYGLIFLKSPSFFDSILQKPELNWSVPIRDYENYIKTHKSSSHSYHGFISRIYCRRNNIEKCLYHYLQAFAGLQSYDKNITQVVSDLIGDCCSKLQEEDIKIVKYNLCKLQHLLPQKVVEKYNLQTSTSCIDSFKEMDTFYSILFPALEVNKIESMHSLLI